MNFSCVRRWVRRVRLMRRDEVPIGAVGRVWRSDCRPWAQFDRNTFGCYGTCRDASPDGGGRSSRGEISERMSVVRNGRTVRYVCRSLFLEPDRDGCLWSGGSETRFVEVLPLVIPSSHGGAQRSARGGVPCVGGTVFQRKKKINSVSLLWCKTVICVQTKKNSYF